MSLMPAAYQVARSAPAGQNQQTLNIVLPKSDQNPTVIDFKDFVGVWAARCPDGTPAKSIQVKCMLSGDAAPLAAAMNLTSAGTNVKSMADLQSFRSDLEFLVDVDVERIAPQVVSNKLTNPQPQWTQFAFQWDGAAASTLILRRVWPSR